MTEINIQRRQKNSQSIKRDAAIGAFLREFAPGSHQELLSQMLVTVCRLAKDNAGKGELKIINMALKELRYAFKTFQAYSHVPKVTMFGSARTGEDHPEYLQAQAFAERIEREGWMVITGAGDGIMRAGHDGAQRESSFGVAISLPFEQGINDIIANDPKLISFRYFFTRKLMFVKEAKAMVLFPGGFGTMDEGFEALTLIQTGKADLVPIVFCDQPGGNYWKRWEQFVGEELLDRGFINPEDVHLYKVTNDVEEAVEEVLHFYKRYHSSRMVGDNLVLRMKSPVNESFIEQLNDEYGDIVKAGKIHMEPGPLDGERGELPELSRLVLKVNRRHIGKLRLMVNAINGE